MKKNGSIRSISVLMTCSTRHLLDIQNDRNFLAALQGILLYNLNLVRT